LHGLGSADMKGGLAVLLELATRASGQAPRHDATFVFYEGEEIADEHNGLRRLFAERRDLVEGDLAILLEPTAGWVEAGCQGTIPGPVDWGERHPPGRAAAATDRVLRGSDGRRRRGGIPRVLAGGPRRGRDREQRRARPLRGRRQPSLRAEQVARGRDRRGAD